RDPVGPLATRSLALNHFRAYAAWRGKHAVLLGASRGMADASRAHGFGSVLVGTEPFFDLAHWTTRGRSGEKLRLAQNHIMRLGGRAREIFPRDVASDRAELQRLEHAWKNARPIRHNASFLRTEPLENAEHRRYFAVEIDTHSGAQMQSFLVCSPVSC